MPPAAEARSAEARSADPPESTAAVIDPLLTANDRPSPLMRGSSSIAGRMERSIRLRQGAACNLMDKGISPMLAMLDTDDLKAVRELERLRIEATRQNDPDVLAPLFHEQLIYLNSAGEVFDKEGYLRAVRTQSLTYDRDFDVRETEVRVLDDVIVLAGVMLGHSRLDGEQQVFHFPCIGVWRKDSGEWRMLAWQSSSGSMAF